MADTTKIEWTEATWNPVVGCSLASPGCTNCYAMKMAGRIEATGHAAYQGLTAKAKTGFVWSGKLGFNEKALLEPLRRRKPTMYFVNSMGDLFHEDCPDEWIDRVFAIMAMAPQHTFQVLTKRSGRMREYMADEGSVRREGTACRITDAAWKLASDLNLWRGKSRVGSLSAWEEGGQDFHDIDAWPLPNVWLGVSVEDQTRADERIPDLLAAPAAVRWLSCEPLLGPVNLEHIKMLDAELFGGGHVIGYESALNGERFDEWAEDDEPPVSYGHEKVDWVVCGGESGPGARPMHPDWARSLRDQCAAAGVPFFFKQWGEWVNEEQSPPYAVFPGEGFDPFGDGDYWAKLGKKRAGRLLDGQEHNAMPEVQ